MFEIVAQITLIAIQNAAYLSSLSWVAWRGERLSGKDSFHVITIYALGVWLLTWNELSTVSRFFILPAVCLLCFLLAEIAQHFLIRGNENAVLVRVVTLSSISLVAFDWLTAHTPVSIAPNSALSFGAMVCGAAVWLVVGTTARQAKWLLALRLGTENSWAMNYWRRDSASETDRTLVLLPRLLSLLCWFPILFIPLATTGLLGGTILKDVAIAILITRVAAARPPIVIFAICLTLALLRAVSAFTITNNAGPPIVEAMIFVTLFGWIRYRGSRTKWGETHAR
jgi:hypothetical protein